VEYSRSRDFRAFRIGRRRWRISIRIRGSTDDCEAPGIPLWDRALARRMRFALLVLVALVLAGCATPSESPATTTGAPAARGGCTPTGLHEHASYAVFIENQSVSWNNAVFAYPRAGSLAGHIHPPNGHVLHMEGRTTCVTVGSFFATALATNVSQDALTLDHVVHDGRTVKTGSEGRLRFFLGEPPAEWKNLSQSQRHYLPSSNVTWSEVPDLPDLQPHDGEYLLMTFGKESDAAIRWQELSIPSQTAAE